jgi:hypothetical protein
VQRLSIADGSRLKYFLYVLSGAKCICCQGLPLGLDTSRTQLRRLHGAAGAPVGTDSFKHCSELIAASPPWPHWEPYCHSNQFAVYM